MSQAGFTLVELLVALALMGLISTLLYSAFTLGMGQWSRAEIKFSRIETALAGQQALRQLLGAAYPRYELTSGNRPAVSFEGSSERMTFLAPLPASLGSGALAEMTISALGPFGTRYLTLEWSLKDSSSPIRTHLLSDTITAVEFTYFGQVAGEYEAAWHSMWSGEINLPQLVRIRVKSAHSSAREVDVEWVVRPRIDVDVGCVYDFVSRTCYGRS